MPASRLATVCVSCGWSGRPNEFGVVDRDATGFFVRMFGGGQGLPVCAPCSVVLNRMSSDQIVRVLARSLCSVGA